LILLVDLLLLRGLIDHMSTQTTPDEFFPHPEELLVDAREEVPRRILDSYYPVISELRSKGFSFAEIAQWFCDKSIYVDKNAVYRTYTKHMSEAEEIQESIQIMEDEKNDHP
jgi:hypothetical protein